jgi:hypothetical protein
MTSADSSVPNPPGKVYVANIRRVSKGSLQAFADVQIGGILVRDFRIVQQVHLGQKAWVSPPQKEWTGDDGKKRYAPIIELSARLKQAVEQAILAAWEGGAA